MKHFLITIALLITSYIGCTQDLNSKNEWFTGGNIGAYVGTITSIDASPYIGYWITNRLAIATGVSYQYYHDTRYVNAMNILGARVFSRFYAIPQLFAHVEYEHLSYKSDLFNMLGLMQRVHVNNILVGGGLNQSFNGNSGMSMMILWNLNDTPESIYRNPLLRIGFQIGL